jgi:hypothetical protein
MIGGVCLVVTHRQNAVCCVIKGGNRNDCDRAKRIPLFVCKQPIPEKPLCGDRGVEDDE